MKRTFYLLFLIYILCTISCRSGSSNRTDTTIDSLESNQRRVIPFKYYGHLYFPVIINDSIRGNFVFDTGGDVLYMDSLFFYHSPLVRDDVSDTCLNGIGNQVQRVKYISHKYSCLCGPLLLFPSSAYVLNIRPIGGKQLDGIIGISVLRDSVFAIDYIKEQMSILRRNDFSTEGYEKIPCSIRNNRIFLRAAVQITPQKRIEGEFMLDTGHGGGIELTTPCAQKNNLAQALPKKIRTYTNWGGIGGSSSSYVAQVEAFYMGKQKIIAPIAAYSEDRQGAMASGEYIGLIGNEILERFDLIVDMPDSCIYLRPNQNVALPFHTTFTGFSHVDRTDICNGWVVRALYEGLAAEKRGLRIGDIIVSINGRKTKEIPFDEQKDFFQKIDSPYTLMIERGKHLFQLILDKVQ